MRQYLSFCASIFIKLFIVKYLWFVFCLRVGLGQWILVVISQGYSSLEPILFSIIEIDLLIETVGVSFYSLN